MKLDTNNIFAHLMIASACAIWGLMAPLGKDAMNNGIDGLDMVTFRTTGGAICFWIASHFMPHEQVRKKDKVLFFFAGLLGIVFNQCCYTVGLSITSPVNASIMTTTMPIITMLLAALFLHEPVTAKKVFGVALGAIGALILITNSTRSIGSAKEGNLIGDILVIGAQCSFALYLTIFKHLIQRYSPMTCMRWMITYAAIVVWPFTYSHMSVLPWSEVPVRAWFETAFVVVCGTFVAYIMMMYAQKHLRPTVISMYNYLQPVVACIVSVCVGLGVFGLSQTLAVILVFTGVYLVTQSKSRRELRREEHNS